MPTSTHFGQTSFTQDTDSISLLESYISVISRGQIKVSLLEGYICNFHKKDSITET